MAETILWDDTFLVTGSYPVADSVMFGYYNADAEFLADAPKAAKWVTRRLGYPVMDLELNQEHLYSCFEEAVTEYSSQVLQFTIRENMMSLMGKPIDETAANYVNLSEKVVVPNLAQIIEISDEYGQEAEVGGKIRWSKGYIECTASVQEYDINALWAVPHESGSALEIKRIYHQEPVAFGYGISGVYNAPGVLGAAGGGTTQGTLSEFGWEGMAAGGMTATGLTYTVMPVYEDLLRMQTIELNFQIRRSGYGFEMRNNKLTLFPVPMGPFRLWFDYIKKEDRVIGSSDGSINAASGTGSVATNIGNAPFDNMEYLTINDPGKRWIYKYTLACVKETLGEIRSKYSEIPIPDSTITLNGNELKSEAEQMKDRLITELREDLERTSTETQMEIQANNAENLARVVTKIPMKIFVG